MKRAFTFLVSFVIFTAFVFAQPKRVVLVEEGTGTGCQWCPRGEVYAHEMLTSYPKGSVAYVAVHGFNASDPMFDLGYRDFLATLGVTGYPDGVANRTKSLNYDNPFVAGSDIDDLMAVPPPANVNVSVSYDNAGSGRFDVELTFEVFETLSGDYRPLAIIVEDGVTGPAPAYNQSNAYSGGGNGPMGGFENLPSPIPADIMVYNHVGRKVLGNYRGAQGLLPSSLFRNNSYDISVNTNYNVGDRAGYIRVIGLLIDGSTGEIVNAGMSDYLNGDKNAKPFFHSNGKTEGFVGLDYEYNIVTHDPEYESLTLSSVKMPNWLSLSDDGTGFGMLTGTPPATGDFEVIIQVTDGNHEVDQHFTISVEEAEEDWIQMGTPGFGKYESNDINIGMDADGNLYAFAVSFDADAAEVYKFENDNWIQIGDDLPVANAFNAGFGVAPDGTIYVADGGIVSKFSNGNWEQVGGAFMTGGTILDPSFAFNDAGEIFVAAASASSSGAPNRCFKWDGSTWVQVGNDINDPGVWTKIKMKADGNPIAIYGAGGPQAFYAQVSDFDGSDWITLGGGGFIDPTDWTRWCFDVEVTVDGAVYAINGNTSDRTLSLWKYENGDWNLHTPGIANGVSDFGATMTSDSEGNLYIAYNDVTAGGGVSVQKFDGTNWRNLGTNGFTPNAKNPRILLDNEGVPVVAYADVSAGERLSVKKFEDLTSSVFTAEKRIEEVLIFPNPNTGIFNLEYSEGERFEVYDYTGRLILNGNLMLPSGEKAIQEIKMEELVQGLYFVKVLGQDKVGGVSFLKE